MKPQDPRVISSGRPRRRMLVAVALVAALGGIALEAQDETDWPQYRGRSDRANFRKVRDKIVVPKVLWKIGRADVPAAVGDDVYAGGERLRRVDLKTGAVKASWRPEGAGEAFAFAGTPAVLEDRVICHASDHRVYCMGRDLAGVLWSSEVPGVGQAWFSGACSDGAFVVSAGAQVVALETADGKTRWTFPLSRLHAVQMSPAIAAGKVLFGTKGGTFYALDLADGKVIWQYDGEREFGWTDPVVAFGKVFVGDRGGFINALDLATGTLAWSLESGATGLSTPGVMPGAILVGFSRVVAVIDVAKGAFDRSKSGFRTDFNPFGSPTLVGNTLYFGNLDGHLYAFDYKTEKLQWAFEVGQEQQVLNFVYHRDVLLVATTEGIYALGNDRTRRKRPANFVLLAGGTSK